MRFLAMCGALLWLCASPSAALSQASARVSTRLSQGVIKLGGEAALIVEVEGVPSAEIISVPEVSGLSIGRPGRPSTRSYTSFVNGRRSNSFQITWGLSIRPFAAGDYTIPPLTLRIGGKEVRTRELKLTVAEDMQGEELGHLVVTPSSTFVVEGQPFSVVVEFGWDARVSRNINFADISLPWWDGLPGTIEIETAEVPGAAVYDGITINGAGSVRAEELKQQTVDGVPFRVFRTRRDYLATRSGVLDFPTSALQFGRMDRSDSFFLSRPPVKRESYYVVKPAFSVTVAPLPEENRPFDYGGAIGQIEVRASTDTRDVFVGDSIKLTVEWTGSGNFEFFEPPDLAKQSAFSDFRVYGRTERSKGIDHRSVVYDLAPLRDSIDQIAPVVLPVYDPVAGAYVEVKTDAVPLNVRALAGAVNLNEEEDTGFGRDLRDIQVELGKRSRLESLLAPDDAGPEARARTLRALGLAGVAGAIAIPLGWWLLRSTVRRRRGDPSAPMARRRRKARKRLSRSLGKAGDAREEWQAVLNFLGERTNEPAEAWIGRELSGGVTNSGSNGAALDREGARALTRLLGDLEGAVYGGRERVARKRVLEVADHVVEAGL